MNTVIILDKGILDHLQSPNLGLLGGHMVAPVLAATASQEPPFVPGTNIGYLRRAQEAVNDPEQAIVLLMSLLLELKDQPLQQATYPEVYELLGVLLPHLVKQRNWLSAVQMLLDNTPDMAFHQQELAAKLGKQFSPKIAEDIQSYIGPFHYYAKALTLFTPANSLYQEVSSLFFNLIRKLYKERLEVLQRLGEFEKFGGAIRNIEQLKYLAPTLQELQDLCQDTQEIIQNAPPVSLPNYTPHLRSVGNILDQEFIPVEFVIAKYHRALKALRQSFTSPQLMFEQWKAFVETVLLNDCFTILGAPPCLFDIRAMGSLGCKNPCPYSDLEYFILIEAEVHRPYFIQMAKLLELQVILLGETAPLDVPIFTAKGPLHFSGFHVDSGDNYNALIRTPQEMANHQRGTLKDISFDSNPLQMMSLKTSTICNNNTSLFSTYCEALQAILDRSQKGGVLRETKALFLMELRLDAFKNIWSVPFSAELKSLDLKHHYICLLNYLMNDLATYSNVALTVTNTPEIVAQLVSKGVFTPVSGHLIQEAFWVVYVARIRLHKAYEQQKDEASFPGVQSGLFPLTTAEVQSLEKAYWLVLHPLYALLKRCLEAKNSDNDEQFKGLDLIEQSFDFFLTQCTQGKFEKSILQHIVQTLCDVNASREVHLTYYTRLGALASKNDEYRSLYLEVLENNNSPHLDVLLEIPNAAGLRRSYVRKQKELRDHIVTVSTSKIPVYNKGRSVKINSSFHTGYLTSEAIEELIGIDGRIRKCDPKSIHNVSPLRIPPIYCKEEPSNPLMEYAVHSLSSRFLGCLTPTVELVSFEVILPNSKEPLIYPVLISEAILGETLKKLEQTGRRIPWSECDQPHWTRMFIATILTRPLDGIPSNYVLTDTRNKCKVFCVDNDVSFVEPLTINKFQRDTIHFCSALFCLFTEAILDKSVLEEFQQVDAPVILHSWLDELIEKEKSWVGLFSQTKLKQLFDLPNSCRIWMLIKEGTLAQLALQVAHLQSYFKRVITQNLPFTAHNLLEQLVSLRLAHPAKLPVGSMIAAQYKKAMDYPTLDKRLGWLTKRNTSQSMISSCSDVLCFGGAPQAEEVDGRKEFSPEASKEELYGVVMDQQSGIVVLRNIGSVDSLHSDFRLHQKESRQRLILEACAFDIQKRQVKPKAMTLQLCSALNSKTLLPLLHEELEYLDIRHCPNIQGQDIQHIQRCCPNLRELYISGCHQIVAVPPYASLSITPPLVFTKLTVFEAQNCQKVTSIRLIAPLLRRFVLNSNLQLERVEVQAFSPIAEIRECPNVKVNNTTIKDIPEWLKRAPRPWKNDKEIVMAAVSVDGLALPFAGEELRKSKDVNLAAVKQNGMALQHVIYHREAAEEAWITLQDLAPKQPRYITSDGTRTWATYDPNPGTQAYEENTLVREYSEIMMAAVKQNGQALKHVGSYFRGFYFIALAAVEQNGLALEHVTADVPGLALAAVKQNGLALKHANPKLKNDRNVVEAAVKQNGLALEFAGEEAKSIFYLVKAAVGQNGLALQYASDHCRRDPDVVFIALKQNREALKYADPKIFEDARFYLAAVREECLFALQYLSGKEDKQMILDIVEENGLTLEYVPDVYKNDRDIALAAVNSNGLALEFVHDGFKNDKDVVLAAVNSNSLALKFAHEQFKNDRDIVLKAIEKNPLALEFAGDTCRNDRELVTVAVITNGAALQFAGEIYKNDRVTVQLAVRNCGKALWYACDELQNNRGFVSELIAQNGTALWYVKDCFQRDQKFVLDSMREGITLRFSREEFREDKEFVLKAVAKNCFALPWIGVNFNKDREVAQTAIQSGSWIPKDSSKEIPEISDYGFSLFNNSNLAKEALIFNFIDVEFLNDEAFMIQAVRQNGMLLSALSAPLRNDYHIVLAAVTQEGRALKFVSQAHKKDRDITLAAVSQNGCALEYVIDEFKGNKEITLAAVNQDGKALQFVSESFKKERDITLAAVTQNGSALKFANEEFRKDKGIVLAAVRQDGNALEFAEDGLKNDRDIVLEAVRQNWNAFEFAGDDCKKDKAIALLAVEQNGTVYKTLCDDLKQDEEIVLAAVRQNGSVLQFVGRNFKENSRVVFAAINQNGRALQYGAEVFRNNPSFVLAAIMQEGEALRNGNLSIPHLKMNKLLEAPPYPMEDDVLKIVHSDIKNDRDFLLTVLEQNGKALQYVDTPFKKDRGVVLTAVMQNGLALEFADDSLRSDPELVLAAVKQDGLALQYASEALKKDPEIVLAAVRQESRALEYASVERRKDYGIVYEAVTQNGLAFQYASDEIKKDRDFARAVVMKSGRALQFVCDELRSDPLFMLDLIKENWWLLNFASDTLKEDNDFILKAVTQNGLSLAFAGNSLFRPRNIEGTALRQNPHAIMYVSSSYKEQFKGIDKELYVTSPHLEIPRINPLLAGEICVRYGEFIRPVIFI